MIGFDKMLTEVILGSTLITDYIITIVICMGGNFTGVQYGSKAYILACYGSIPSASACITLGLGTVPNITTIACIHFW